MTASSISIIAIIAVLSFYAGLLVGRKFFGSLAYREGKYDQKHGVDFHKYWEEE